jgi:hypothetical protein
MILHRTLSTILALLVLTHVISQGYYSGVAGTLVILIFACAIIWRAEESSLYCGRFLSARVFLAIGWFVLTLIALSEVVLRYVLRNY